ncbi:hypothetical protein BCR33DRAFT_788450 [Rhizoclosmatium globosum]|uniref:Uncharacterized protein n=1 Tax=Rhizoclosmatium globosum TaxID=329046 RepID=A0A1Y2BWH1_9FUNG|nr:hypothetical protein BCR33DRAFT_788450 [Rhizoclosmatium globosum]|eukprot:ORY38997.1 hypothetical protein BCR33DRAFT_788450 [Rhizoclosmatium globosum]
MAQLSGDQISEEGIVGTILLAMQQMRDEARRQVKTHDDAVKSEANLAQRSENGRPSSERKRCKWCQKNHSDDSCFVKYPEKAPDWFKEMLEKKKKRKEEVGNFADIGKSNKGSGAWGDPPYYFLLASLVWQIIKMFIDSVGRVLVRNVYANAKPTIQLPCVKKGESSVATFEEDGGDELWYRPQPNTQFKVG